MKNGNDRRRRTITLLVCAVILLSGAFYLISWNAGKEAGFEREERYAKLYDGDSTEMPTVPATQDSATTAAAPERTPRSSATPRPSRSPVPTTTATLEPFELSTSTPDPDAPTPTPAILDMTLPTEPPTMLRFASLLELNPETVGYLQVGEIRYPVVQRSNDNSYYLSHTFEGVEDRAGAIFMDGANLLNPEDDCLIVYGHNMKDRTMFGRLAHYRSRSGFRELGIVRFDTIYEERRYVPFAVFTASMEREDRDYFELRRFIFDDSTQFDAFVQELRDASRVDVDIDIQYGDRLLLLVTCSSSDDDGRMVLALRAVREGEDETALEKCVRHAK